MPYKAFVLISETLKNICVELYEEFNLIIQELFNQQKLYNFSNLVKLVLVFSHLKKSESLLLDFLIICCNLK